MSIKKLVSYITDNKILLRSDHLPLKKFLLRNTKNDMVNNWAMELQHTIEFEYIQGMKNTLADRVGVPSPGHFYKTTFNFPSLYFNKL